LAGCEHFIDAHLAKHGGGGGFTLDRLTGIDPVLLTQVAGRLLELARDRDQQAEDGSGDPAALQTRAHRNVERLLTVVFICFCSNF
jgi:hypothetical protein